MTTATTVIEVIANVGEEPIDPSSLQPVPEGAQIVGELPQVLQRLWSRIIRLCTELREQAEQAETAGEEVTEEFRRTFGIMEVVRKIFWGDVRAGLDKEYGRAYNTFGIADGWQIWAQIREKQEGCGNPDCQGCALKREVETGNFPVDGVLVIMAGPTML